MNLRDYLLLALLAVCVLLALRYLRRHRGGCGGDCTRCAQSGACKEKEQNAK